MWDSTIDNKKIHLTLSLKICCPKEDGGLGFKNLQWLNLAYTINLTWQLIINYDKLLWCVQNTHYKCVFKIVSTCGFRKTLELDVVELWWIIVLVKFLMVKWNFHFFFIMCLMIGGTQAFQQILPQDICDKIATNKPPSNGKYNFYSWNQNKPYAHQCISGERY